VQYSKEKRVHLTSNSTAVHKARNCSNLCLHYNTAN